MFDFIVTPDNGEPFNVTATGRDVMAWERKGKDRSLHRLTRDMRMTDLYSLAHTAAQRQGLFSGDLRDFEESVELDVADEDEEAEDPTRPGATAAR